MNTYLLSIAVFFATVIVDLAWSLYIRFLAKDKIVSASVFSSLIILLGAFSTLSYIDNRWMILPAAVGAFVGTLISKRVETFVESRFPEAEKKSQEETPKAHQRKVYDAPYRAPLTPEECDRMAAEAEAYRRELEPRLDGLDRPLIPPDPVIISE